MHSTAGISYYLNKMLDVIKRVINDSFVFQQDSAPVHFEFNKGQLLLLSIAI